ncbi:MAG: NUDIX hydrolase [Parcubacteria group bacterium GW2011_GWC1_38_6]|nr:MAG: NUDIX hydrolase [Parcubacteria group bacterium GW2011_GWA1_36_12]KKQ76091.1 MAG: NUDIX hydrolase [Parcubacteria group bacterium GW2011_GWC1_38_6]
MPIRKSAGAIIFHKENNQVYYLLLEYPSSLRNDKKYWGFSKGTMEQGEEEMDTIIREIKEETGLEDLDFVEGFKETEKYFFKEEGKTIFKTVSYLLAETRTKEVKISHEHLSFTWLSYEEALKKLTFKNAKEILKKANSYLTDCSSSP